MPQISRKLLVGLVIVFAVQMLCLSRVQVRIERDAAEYVQLAQNLLSDGNFSFDGETPTRGRQPVYPLFLIAFYLLPGKSLLLLQIVQVILGLATFSILFKLLSAAAQKAPGYLALLALALYLPVWINCIYVLPEMLTIFLLTLGVWMILLGRQGRGNKYLAIAGVVIGISILTKPICIALLATLWVPLIFSKSTRGLRVRQVALIYSLVIVTLIPWSIRNYAKLGDFVPVSSEGAGNLMYAAGPDTPERREELLYKGADERAEPEAAAISTAVGQIADAPFAFLWRGIQRIVWVWTYFPGTRDYFHHLWARMLSHGLQLALLVLAAFGIGRVERPARALLLFGPLAFSLLFMFTYAISRYLLPVMPFVVVAVALGIDAILHKIRTRFSLLKQAETS